jgi:hypothetical protein
VAWASAPRDPAAVTADVPTAVTAPTATELRASLAVTALVTGACPVRPPLAGALRVPAARVRVPPVVRVPDRAWAVLAPAPAPVVRVPVVRVPTR